MKSSCILKRQLLIHLFYKLAKNQTWSTNGYPERGEHLPRAWAWLDLRGSTWWPWRRSCWGWACRILCPATSSCTSWSSRTTPPRPSPFGASCPRCSCRCAPGREARRTSAWKNKSSELIIIFFFNLWRIIYLKMDFNKLRDPSCKMFRRHVFYIFKSYWFKQPLCWKFKRVLKEPINKRQFITRCMHVRTANLLLP